MKQFKLWNNTLGWIAFAIAAVVYTLTLEPTASFWDCAEFIVTAAKLEVGHPPGNPIFMLTGRFFANFASGAEEVAYMVNFMSGILSAATILFLFWTITHMARRIMVKDGEPIALHKLITIMGCGMVGALAYAFSDTFWFSAVEGEVYAYSSFCTAIVFWLILKWEDVADEPHANKYIILIAYLIGVSIAVHLLNLLCIPAIVLVYYFRKSKAVNLKGTMIALALSFVIILFLLYGLIPGYIKVTGWAELLFVNTLGLPYNSGAIFYVLATIAAIIWSLIESYSQRSDLRIKLSFLITVSMLGVPFLGSGVWIGLAVIAALAIYLFNTATLPHQLLNTILLSLMVIFIGYSSYALIMIRSTANPPMDQNSPEDVFTLASYINREQYGNRPLLYGYTFVSDVQRDLEGRPVSKQGSAIWRKAIKSDPNEKDKYVVIGYQEDYEYTPELNMLFPRMYSRDARHIEAYKQWSNFKGSPTSVRSDGQPRMVNKPTMGENLRFFLDYQLNFMYWRYFMWNFVGRQSDNQSVGDIQDGNWITGIKFIDNIIEGNQDTLPSSMRDNPGRNVYYMLPLLLGIIGILYQSYAGKRGVESFWITFLLFFMTGIAIVIYLNQTPFQPRERDYAYAGSFYAFAIWIGLGVAGIVQVVERYLPKRVAAIAVSLLALFVPIQMIGQNWDDHDRSGRYACRDFGKNYLSCIEPNGIIFTNGDNDTFPLWYVQEVEGYRTDVRVCNLSYLQTDWYINQMKYPAYESTPLPITMKEVSYSQGKRDFAYLIERIKQPISLEQAINYLVSEDKATKTIPGYNERIDYIPSKKLFLDIDSAQVVASGAVSPQRASLITNRMDIDLSGKAALTKNEIAVLDMLNTISKEGWERPLYYSVTVASNLYLNLEKYMTNVGLAYRVTPATGTPEQLIDTDAMYDNMVNKFVWGGIDQEGVYLDETIRRLCRTQRMMFATLINALIDKGETEKALTALDYCMKVIPGYNVPHEYFSIQLGEAYFTLGKNEQATQLLNSIADNYMEYLRWYTSLTPRKMESVQDNISLYGNILKNIIQLYQMNGENELAKKYVGELNALV